MGVTVDTTHTIHPQPLTVEGFAPFGDVLSLEGTPRLPIDFYSGSNAVHGPVTLDSDERPEFLVFRVGVRGEDVRYLERHVGMTQTMISVDGKPYVAVVAPPHVPEVDGFPAFDHIRAFSVPGGVAVNLHRGTWHEPPFPSSDGQVFLITSHPRLTQGLQCPVDENGELNRFDVEKRSPVHRTRTRLRIALP